MHLEASGCRCSYQGQDVYSDKRTITIYSPSANLYVIDFDIEMEMLIDVVIKKTNHSLFSARIAEDLTVVREMGHLLLTLCHGGETAALRVL